MCLLFDRGTIVLREPPPNLPLAELPEVLWDPRVAAFRTPARNHGLLCARLAERGVRFTDDVRPTGRAPDPWPPVELRPYQESALSAWELAGRRGVVVLPTGSRKTRLAVAVMARTGLRALCLVPTRALLEQWSAELARHYRGRVGRYGDGVREDAPITVATFESAWRQMERIGASFDLLVIDEAHHFGAGMRDEALEMSIAPARLGLTATPPAPGRVASRLADLIGPTVYELAIGDLAGRFLADFDQVTLHVDLATDERRIYEADIASFRAFHSRFRELHPETSWEDFARAAARVPQGREALAALRRAKQALLFPPAKREMLGRLLGRHRDARLLVFTADNQSAYAIAREHLIMPLTCDNRPQGA